MIAFLANRYVEDSDCHPVQGLTLVCNMNNRHVPLDEPIDLLNVAFENPRKLVSRNNGDKSKRRKVKYADATELQHLSGDRSAMYNVPDRLSGLEELEELRQTCPGRQWNFVRIRFLLDRAFSYLIQFNRSKLTLTMRNLREQNS